MKTTALSLITKADYTSNICCFSADSPDRVDWIWNFITYKPADYKL